MGLWALLYILCGPWARAEDLERQFLREMTHARNISAIERLRAEYSALKIARTACHIQLMAHSVPAACYELAHLQARHGHAVAAEHFHKLDHLCALASERESYRGDLAPLSGACAENVRNARAIQAYRGEDHDEWSMD